MLQFQDKINVIFVVSIMLKHIKMLANKHIVIHNLTCTLKAATVSHTGE